MRYFSFRPALTYRGRTFKGLRGWAGKPLHPPLTDVPVAAYVLAAVFDVLSAVGDGEQWGRDLYRAASYVLVAGAVVSVPTALTGVWDWLKSTPRGTQAWRTANAHALAMVTVTLLVLVNVLARANAWDDPSTPTGLVVLSLVVALLTTIGAAYGGSLVYDYGFNVETAGDHPVWHESETDVLPGQPKTLPGPATPEGAGTTV